MKKILVVALLLIPTICHAGSFKSLFNRDPGSGGIINVTPEHHASHEGSRFVISNVQDLALNNVYDIQITTPNTTTWAHCTFLTQTEAETDVYLYENVTINTPGTAITSINRNRNSSTTSTLVMKGISNTSTANANSDTAVAGATLIGHATAGAGVRSGGAAEDREEYILKQNEDYTFRIVAIAAGYTSYMVDCYEHDNDEVH